jgi:hypothetical protein
MFLNVCLYVMETANEQAGTSGQHEWVQVGPASSLAVTSRMHTCIQVIDALNLLLDAILQASAGAGH